LGLVHALLVARLHFLVGLFGAGVAQNHPLERLAEGEVVGGEAKRIRRKEAAGLDQFGPFGLSFSSGRIEVWTTFLDRRAGDDLAALQRDGLRLGTCEEGDQLLGFLLMGRVLVERDDVAVYRMRRLRPIDFAVAAAIYRLRMSRELIRESRMSSL
jgi:hypothetical protein